MPRRRGLGRTLREVFEAVRNELRADEHLTEVERMVMETDASGRHRPIPVRDPSGYASGGVVGPVRLARDSAQETVVLVRRTIPVETLRERSTQAPRPSLMNTMAVWPPFAMVVSGSPLVLPRQDLAPLTITQSRQIPNALAPSTPLQPEPSPPTVSSTPAAVPPIPIAWDDPTIKRVRRVVIEDE